MNFFNVEDDWMSGRFRKDERQIDPAVLVKKGKN